MTEKDRTARAQLDRLTDLLVEDALALSDAELLSEAAKDREDANAAVARVREDVSAATAKVEIPRRPDMSENRHQTFPDDGPDYRAARDELLAEEIELRRQTEKVSALRRSLPLGGAVKDDYVFKTLSGEDLKLSELFSDKSSDLLIYSFMYKPGGSACPVCTSLLDGLNGSAPHIRQNLNFVVTAKASVDELNAWAESRGWSNLILLSSGKTTYNLDYNAEDEEERQLMMMNMFRKSDDGIFHAWSYEKPNPPTGGERNPLQRDQIWPLLSIHELALDGRPSDWRPAYRYD